MGDLEVTHTSFASWHKGEWGWLASCDVKESGCEGGWSAKKRFGRNFPVCLEGFKQNI